MTLERGGEIVLLLFFFYMNKGAPIYGECDFEKFLRLEI